MEWKFPGKKFRKCGYTSRGCPLFRNLCKFPIFYSALLATITASWTSHAQMMRIWSKKHFRTFLHICHKYYIQLNLWRKRFIKIMPQWCTCLFCIGWLGNLQIFITRAEPLYDSLNPLLCDAFATVVVCALDLCCCGLYKMTMSTYQCSVCFYICDLNLKVIEKFQANNYRLPHWKKTTICPWKFPEIRPGIFGWMVSAHGLGRAYRKVV